MATEIERSFTGTNFAVVTLIVLLLAVGVYYVIATGKDVADDNIGETQRSMSVR